MKKLFTTTLILLVVVVLIFGIFLLYATVTEYKPELVEELPVHKILLPTKDIEGSSPSPESSENLPENLETPKQALSKEETNPKTIGITLWNIGYAGLGAEQDFILDGGDSNQASQIEAISYLRGIESTLTQLASKSDILLLQEVDIDSKRSFSMNMYRGFQELFPDYHSVFATNYKAPFVPFPVKTPIGKVHSGIATLSRFPISQAIRYALPSKESWPVSPFHLKRGLLVTRIPLKDADLVVINGHYSAYGPELLPEQLRITKELMLREYETGNYVIVGADWNQIPPVTGAGAYPLGENTLYVPEEIPANWTPTGWNWGVDISVPTYRLLDKPYQSEQFNQIGIIDSFLLSPNLKIEEVRGVDLSFTNSDHNPVYIKVGLESMGGSE